ncbi:MAG TPA: hypothetical protein VGE30_02040 [Candidatus Saccharimonadales bacterium]
MEKSPFSFDESKAVVRLQFRHYELLQGSSVLDKIHTQAILSDQYNLVQQGWPIVLGSENEGVRFLFIALRMPPESEIFPVQSQYYTIGRSMGDVILPNSSLGITDEEYLFVDSLFSEAVQLTQTEAPHYSLESGILRQ